MSGKLLGRVFDSAPSQFFFVIKLHLPQLHYQLKSLVMSLSSSNKVGNPVKKKIVLISHISEGHPLRRLRPLGDK
jgi:hypothetical protein